MFGLTIEKRTQKGNWGNLIPPLVAIVVTILGSILILTSFDVAPARALYFLYISPFASWFNFAEVILKMGPLLLIAQGLAIGFRAKIWNIRAN